MKRTGEKRPAIYHVLANSYLEFVDGDHARLEAYWMTGFELVRSHGRWLIQSHDVAPKD